MNVEKDKVKCGDFRCGWKGQASDILTAPHPFHPNDTISGCPKCRDVETLECVCDEPGCWETVSAGTPTPEGYRSTCHKHAP